MLLSCTFKRQTHSAAQRIYHRPFEAFLGKYLSERDSIVSKEKYQQQSEKGDSRSHKLNTDEVYCS